MIVVSCVQSQFASNDKLTIPVISYFPQQWHHFCFHITQRCTAELFISDIPRVLQPYFLHQTRALQPRCFLLSQVFSFAASAFLKAMQLGHFQLPCHGFCNHAVVTLLRALQLSYFGYLSQCYGFAAVNLCGACSHIALVLHHKLRPCCWQLIGSQAKELLLLAYLLCYLQPFCFHFTRSHSAVLLLVFYCMCYSLDASPLQSFMQPRRFIADFHRCYSLAAYT